MGHIVRCVTLAGAFRDTGIETVFLTWSPDGIGKTIIETADFDLDESYGPAATPDDLTFVLDRARQELRTPLLVLDSRNVDKGYVEACRNIAVVVCLDDDLMRDLPCDALINNNVWATESDYGPDQERALFLGPCYNLVKPVFFRIHEIRSEPRRPHVLVTMGGEDPSDQTSRFLALLGESLVSCSVTIVVGPAHPDADAVSVAARRYTPHAGVIAAPTDLSSLMARADLAITAGGTTCYELAAAGVSQAAVILDDHQEKLVRALADVGCLIQLGRYDNLEIDLVRHNVESLIASADERERLASAGKQLLQGPGAPRIVDELTKLWAEHQRTNL